MSETNVDRQDVLRVASLHLGPVRVLHDRSWVNGEATVLELEDEARVTWIAKGHAQGWAYQRERTAMTDWAPTLGDRAPTLVAFDDEAQTLVMTRLPGVAGTATSAASHFQAGELISRLHGIGATTQIDDYAETMHQQLDAWLERVPGVLSDDEAGWVRANIEQLDSLPAPAAAPTHNDYQPRNWMLDDAGTIRMIDFGRAKVDMLLRDFERLWFQDWASRPDLRAAFFAGYGRDLNPHEVSLIVVRGAYQAASTILWARERDDVDFERHGWTVLNQLRSVRP